jgi:hypothetical protein
VVIAAALSALLLVGLASAAALAIGRGVWQHQREERIEQARERLDDRLVPPGQRRKLDQGQERGQGPMMRDRLQGLDRGNGLGMMMRGATGLGNVQHGEFTVTGPDGKAATMTVQRGEVTKVSDTSLTVKSEDGFTATYAVSVDTRRTGAKDLATGDTVFVIAEKAGAKAVLVQARR